MSSILEALKKVEAERAAQAQGSAEERFHPATAGVELLGEETRLRSDRAPVQLPWPIIAGVMVVLLIALSTSATLLFLRQAPAAQGDGSVLASPPPKSPVASVAPPVPVESQVPAPTETVPDTMSAAEPPLAPPGVNAAAETPPPVPEQAAAAVEVMKSPPILPPAEPPMVIATREVSPAALDEPQEAPAELRAAAAPLPDPTPAAAMEDPPVFVEPEADPGPSDENEPLQVEEPPTLVRETVTARRYAWSDALETPAADASEEPRMQTTDTIPEDIRQYPRMPRGERAKFGLEELTFNLIREEGSDTVEPHAVINLIKVYLGERIPGSRTRLVAVRRHGVAIEIESTGERYYVPRR